MSTPRLTEIAEKSGFDYRMAIAKGRVQGSETFTKIGYNAAVGTSEEDIWVTGAGYVWPAAAAQWRIAAGNAGDAGTVIKGNAEGADQTIKCDATGTATTLIDADVDFTAATGVAVGDIVLLDPKGTNPEFGYITDITDAATGTLVIGGGFSGGGACDSARAYTIVDKSATAGAQVVELYYLTSAFVEKKIYVVLNGASAVDIDGSGGAALTDTYRINNMRVVAAGSGGAPVAAIVLQLQASPNTVYASISAGYLLARDGFYTVPARYNLYVSGINFAAATPNDTKVQTARMTLRSTMEDYSGFITPGLFYPYAEALISNGSEYVELPVPIKFTAGADIKVSAIGITAFSGPVSCVLRGWLEIA
jgi:hypothetical protein